MWQFANATDAIDVYTEVFPPYQVIDDQGELSGWAHQIVIPLLTKAGLSYKLHVYPWARAYKSALNNSNSLIYSIMRTNEREPLFEWLVPLCTLQMSFYSLSKRTDIDIKNFDGIKQLKIGITREQAKKEYLIRKGFENNLVEVNNNEQLRKMMEFDRVDLIMTSDDHLAHLVAMKELPAGTFKRQFRVQELNNTLYLASNKALAPKVAESIQSAISQMKDSINRKCYLSSD
ncbi:substrate-binding periplasmic protein [Thalassotalea ganghwensis]